MAGGGAPVSACPRCGSLIVGMSPCALCGYIPYQEAMPAPGYAGGPFPLPASSEVWRPTPPAIRSPRWLRRTRRGLLLTAIGLLLSWTPFLAVLGAVFLSLGSTSLFLGARGAGRKHEIAVVFAFFFLGIGGVAVGFLLGAFLLQAYQAAEAGQAMATLRDGASLLIWASLPATFAVTAGFGLQVVLLLPRRQQVLLLALGVALAATAALATWLSAPEVATLGAERVRQAAVTEFLLRLSLYRMIEAPPYVGLGLLYLATYAQMFPGWSPPRPIARAHQG